MKPLSALLTLSITALFVACRTPAPSAPIDLSAPGWETRQGQAVWRSEEKKPEIAGDIVLSTHPNGSAYIHFSKTLPILTGRVTPTSWEIDFPPENKHYSGHGRPPKKLVWLQLLLALEGETVPTRWRLIHPSDRYIALENPDSGERLEIQFQK